MIKWKAIKNWPLPPDYVINLRIPDNDLINRREGERIDPITGALYIKEQYAPTPVEKAVSFSRFSLSLKFKIILRLVNKKQMMMMLAKLMRMMIMMKKKPKKKNKFL